MRPKSLFAGRPGLDNAVRAVSLGAMLVLVVAAVATRDARTGALAVGLGAFIVRETFELDPVPDRIAVVVFWGGLAAWAVLMLA